MSSLAHRIASAKTKRAQRDANQVPTMKRSATHQSSDRGPQRQKSAPNNQPTSSNRSISSSLNSCGQPATRRRRNSSWFQSNTPNRGTSNGTLHRHANTSSDASAGVSSEAKKRGLPRSSSRTNIPVPASDCTLRARGNYTTPTTGTKTKTPVPVSVSTSTSTSNPTPSGYETILTPSVSQPHNDDGAAGGTRNLEHNVQ